MGQLSQHDVQVLQAALQDQTDVVTAITNAINDVNPKLYDINKKIHANPELGYAEFQAHDNITKMFEDLGYQVTKHAYGLETSFLVEYGTGGRVVAFNAEYDALPGIGHACGHNLIAMMSIGAFLGVAKMLKESGIKGRVRLVGTPAEEGGGGKLKLIDAGAYQDVDACLMVHPGPLNGCPGFTGDAYMPTIANHKFSIHFTGRSAHAAVAPWEGINALDAVVLAYNGISMLRQQIMPAERIHSVISEGGKRPNIIPEHASLEYYIRSPTLKSADALMSRALKCFEGAALQTGCTMKFEKINTYADVRNNKSISSLYAAAMGNMGSPVKCDFAALPLPGSTDQGNVSYECPAFHGYVGIQAAPGATNHTPGFTAAAEKEEAHTLCLESAKGMAIVGWQILADENIAKQVRQDFEDDRNARESDVDLRMYDPLPGGGCC
ncbi:hypothetical protein ARAM_003711 [Aspergillus rambellii]|uniref:Peptidase M20 domain-containing protein 2 n=1 Tax=Aspergillus rambellii TaxID=308745 RepID=A0A0F8V1P6_9EURO|nr:hypothetical protein ARAM_003711 [Aspergillus rambellii]